MVKYEGAFLNIGLLTNLHNLDQFKSSELGFATSSQIMQATGGNTGNVAFVDAIKKILGDSYTEIQWGLDPSEVSANFDAIVICCANQLGSHADISHWGEKLKKFSLPVVLIGLGAQSDEIGQIPNIPNGTLSALEIIHSLRPDANQANIITRGAFSSEVLASLGFDSIPIGCPSQFHSSSPNLGEKCLSHKKNSSYGRAMVAGGNPWAKSARIERLLIDVVNNTNGEYILQHPQIMFELSLGEVNNIAAEHMKMVEEKYAFLGDSNKIFDWFQTYTNFFCDSQTWINRSRSFSLALGPRFHGVILPIQAGVPGKVIAIDSRTEELAVTTGVPYIQENAINGKTPEELIEACIWTEKDAEMLDQKRIANANEYISFLFKNKLKPSPHLYKIAQGKGN